MTQQEALVVYPILKRCHPQLRRGDRAQRLDRLAAVLRLHRHHDQVVAFELKLARMLDHRDLQSLSPERRLDAEAALPDRPPVVPASDEDDLVTVLEESCADDTADRAGPINDESHSPRLRDRLARALEPGEQEQGDETGFVVENKEMPARVFRGDDEGALEDTVWHVLYQPLLGVGGQVSGILAVNVEVTEFVQQRRILSRLAAEQSAILEQLILGVIATDAAGKITFINEAAQRMHGQARLDVEPDDCTATYQLFTEDGQPYPPLELPLSRAVLRDEVVREERWRIRRPDGTEVLVEGSARPTLADNGEKLGAVLTLHVVRHPTPGSPLEGRRE